MPIAMGLSLSSMGIFQRRGHVDCQSKLWIMPGRLPPIGRLRRPHGPSTSIHPLPKVTRCQTRGALASCHSVLIASGPTKWTRFWFRFWSTTIASLTVWTNYPRRSPTHTWNIHAMAAGVFKSFMRDFFAVGWWTSTWEPNFKLKNFSKFYQGFQKLPKACWQNFKWNLGVIMRKRRSDLNKNLAIIKNISLKVLKANLFFKNYFQKIIYKKQSYC